MLLVSAPKVEGFVASASEIATEELFELESHVSRRFGKQSLPSLAAFMASEQAVVALMASEQTIVGRAMLGDVFDKQSLLSLSELLASEQTVAALMSSEQRAVGEVRAEGAHPVPAKA